MSDVSLNDIHLDLDTDLLFERAEENLLSSVSGNEMLFSSDSSTYEVDLTNVEDYLKRGLFVPTQGFNTPYLQNVYATVTTINTRVNALNNEVKHLNNRVDALVLLLFISVFVPWIKSIVRRIMFKKNREE